MDAQTLLLTDIVDSTLLNAEHGDSAMAVAWRLHDQSARKLVRRWKGREIARSDGLLLLFAKVEEAVGFAVDYHRTVQTLPVPMRARVAIHLGPVAVRENDSEDRALGAPAFELDGIVLPTAARIVGVTLGGQTLLSAAAKDALAPELAVSCRLSRGFWQFKGVPEPVELFEWAASEGGLRPMPDSDKAYGVVWADSRWMPRNEVPNNIPAERTSFVGRSRELRLLSDSFSRGARLVSLHGMGGIGKSRLALRFAGAMLGDYPGGVWSCDLSRALSLEDIAHAVALAIDVPIALPDVIGRVGSALKGRGKCLLILDNFEQAARQAEHCIGHWMEHAKEARFLVTTRELLKIEGEVVQIVAPLVSEEAAVLFRDRADAFVGRDDSGVAAVEELVELLDRLPLAIELAAARIRTLSPQAMALRMNERFRLLTSQGGRRDRQATLRATLDWSWDLLCESERRLLANLAVFAGGFSLEIAETVLEEPATGWIPDLLQSLVDKSLLRCDENRRLDLLGTVLDYATEKLSAANESDGRGASPFKNAMRRHWVYFAGLSEAEATRHRCAERHNLVAACRRCHRRGQ